MIEQMIVNASSPTMSERFTRNDRQRTFQATVSGDGAVAAQVVVSASNDLIGWIQLGTINLSGTDVSTDGFASQPMWEHTRAQLVSISGMNAKVNVTLGHA